MVDNCVFIIPNNIALLFSYIYVIRDGEKEQADWQY